MPQYLKLPLLLTLFYLTGCTKHPLSVHTDYFDHRNLASYNVSTPDPQLRCPPFGQRLFISWSLSDPQFCLKEGSLYVDIHIRYRDQSEKHLKKEIEAKKGSFILRTLNDDYCRTGGILSYHVVLMSDGECLSQVKHRLWANLIDLEAVE